MSSNRGGRPPIDPQHAQRVNVKLPGELYDQAYRVASQTDRTVPEVIRRVLQRHLPAGAEEDDD